MSWVERTTKTMHCDFCKTEGQPYPEADGSLGLVNGWFHYDPNFMMGFLVKPISRVDFCSEECRAKWFHQEIQKLEALLGVRAIVYQFKLATMNDIKGTIDASRSNNSNV